MSRKLTSFCALVALMLTTSPTQARPCTVSTAVGFSAVTHGSIQDAIDDTTCESVYLPDAQYQENVLIDRSVELRGAGADHTEVLGGGLDSVFIVESSALSVTLAAMTISDGAAELGGGIYNMSSELFVEDCTIQNNQATGVAGVGGGIYNAGILTLSRSEVLENNASFMGGGSLTQVPSLRSARNSTTPKLLSGILT
jgi:hypothetical protein